MIQLKGRGDRTVYAKELGVSTCGSGQGPTAEIPATYSLPVFDDLHN